MCPGSLQMSPTGNDPGAVGQLSLTRRERQPKIRRVNRGFSTTEVSATERVDFWREMVRRHFVPLRIDPLAPAEFNGTVRLRSIADLSVARLHANPMRATRTWHHIEHSASDEYFIGLHLRGLAFAEQGGRRATLYPGDFALFDSARPYSIEFRSAGTFDHLILRVPRLLLDSRSAQLERATAVAVTVGSEAGRLMSPSLQTFVSLTETAPFADPILDLLTSALTQAAGLVTPPQSRQQRALQQVKRYTLSHLGDPTLSPAHVADGCFISLRQVHRLFALEHTTFSEFVQNARLDRCHRDLADPNWAGLTIAEIARHHGYRSAAVFSRAFNDRYGTSPGAFRRMQPPDAPAYG
jgi:AraC-like DNA-binding protein